MDSTHNEDQPLPFTPDLSNLTEDERKLVQELADAHERGEDISQRAQAAGIPTFTDYLNSERFKSMIENKMAAGTSRGIRFSTDDDSSTRTRQTMQPGTTRRLMEMVWQAKQERSPYVQCKNCGEECCWMKTHAGKNILVDKRSIPDTWNEGDIYDRTKMTCHFETCSEKD